MFKYELKIWYFSTNIELFFSTSNFNISVFKKTGKKREMNKFSVLFSGLLTGYCLIKRFPFPFSILLMY